MQTHFCNQAEFMKKELQKEKDTTRVWTNSGKRTHKFLTDNHWKEGLGYNAEIAKEKEETEIKSQPENKPLNKVLGPNIGEGGLNTISQTYSFSF